MTKKLPSKIFVRWEQPSRDEQYLMASEDMYSLVDGKPKIGTYVLVETVEAELVVSTSAPVKVKPSR